MAEMVVPRRPQGCLVPPCGRFDPDPPLTIITGLIQLAQIPMSSNHTDPPFLQRAYDSIWLLALAALVFWTLTYVIWGLIDILSVPAG